MVRLGALALLASCTSPCLVRFAAAQGAVTPTPLTDESILGINLVRTAKLTSGVSKVEKGTNLEDAAKGELNTGYETFDDNCGLSSDFLKTYTAGVVLTTPVANVKDTPAADTVKKLLQETLTKGLDKMGADFTAGMMYDPGQRKLLLDSRDATNVAVMMNSKSTKVGCAFPKGCKGGDVLIICKFEPALDAVTPLFTKETYSSLLARKNAKVDISALTEADLNTKPDQMAGAAGLPVAAGIVVSLVGLLATL